MPYKHQNYVGFLNFTKISYLSHFKDYSGIKKIKFEHSSSREVNKKKHPKTQSSSNFSSVSKNELNKIFRISDFIGLWPLLTFSQSFCKLIMRIAIQFGSQPLQPW